MLLQEHPWAVLAVGLWWGKCRGGEAQLRGEREVGWVLKGNTSS